MQSKEISNENADVYLVAYSVSDEVEDCVKKELEVLLKKYDLIKLHHPIYTCVKELIMNAIKANFKNIYFEDYSAKNKQPGFISYEVALKLFMLEMTREDAQHLERIARKKDIKAEVKMWADDRYLNFQVNNPVPMTDIEQENVLKKLQTANKINDMSEYFIEVENDPNREGAGLGLVLITLMLKGIVRDYSSIEIKSDGIKTTAFMKIPYKQSELFVENF